MTDVIENTEAPAVEAPADKPAKTKAEPHPCLCGFFEVGVFDSEKAEAEQEIFSTGCEATTLRTFAQGHDARLVSFLVDGYFDGYALRFVKDGVGVSFATPADAALKGSEALAEKARKATDNRQAKNDAKGAKQAEREAAKAERDAAKAKAKEEKAAAKEAAKADKPQAEVAAGSSEGDLPELAEGQARIKVGRWEYTADIDADGNASFVDGKGEAQVINRDGYRVL
jgi:hypothetical protein